MNLLFIYLKVLLLTKQKKKYQIKIINLIMEHLTKSYNIYSYLKVLLVMNISNKGVNEV